MRTTTIARRVIAAVLAVAALAAMVLLSGVTWRASAPDAAELRLSWRVPAPSQRTCRPPTDEELSGVLPHMRPAEVCADAAVSFRLTVRLNGDTLHSAPVERSGPRARTITVFESFPLPPGAHALAVTFLPEPPPGSAADSADAAQPSADAAMTLSARVTAGPGDVILVARDEGGRLSATGPPP